MVSMTAIAALRRPPRADAAAMAWFRAGRVAAPTEATRTLKRRHTPLTTSLSDVPEDLDARHFLAGQQVEEFARTCVVKAVAEVGRPVLDKEISWASLCTGSGGDAIAALAFEKAARRVCVMFRLKCKLLCEIAKDKREWAMQVHALNGANPCAFSDLTNLRSQSSACAAHDNTACKLPQELDFAIAGISCRDWSKSNPNRKIFHDTDALAQGSSPGGSVNTAWELLSFLKCSHPEVVIVENSDELAGDQHKHNLDRLLYEFAQRSYDTRHMLIDANDYGLPQRKQRMWIVAVLRPGRRFEIASFDEFFNGMLKLMKLFKCRPPSFVDTLLGEGNKLLEKDLAERQKAPPKGWDSSSLGAHRAAWAKRGLRMQEHQPRQADKDSAWFKTLTPREADGLAYHQSSRAVGDPDTIGAKQSLYDTNNSILHPSFGAVINGVVVCPTIMPSAKMWISVDSGATFSRSVHRIMHGSEALCVNGWPSNDPKYQELILDRSSKFLNDLAGNAFAPNVVVAILTSVFFAAEYTSEEQARGAGKPA